MEIRWRTASAQLFLTWPGYIKSLLLSLRHFVVHARRVKNPAVSGLGFDLVTVVFKAELTLLRLQARSIARFLDPSFAGAIVVIVNDLDQRETIDLITRHVLPDYGPWQDRVAIVPYHRIGHGLDPANGWIVQQALKLAIARALTRPFYVLLDAKNHLVRPATPDMFVNAEGKAIQPLRARETSLPDHWNACLRFFGQDPPARALAPCAPMTPFVMHTETVRRLVHDVETRENRSLFSVFATTRLLSEFLMYQIYLMRAAGSPHDDLYVEGPELSVTLWPHDSHLAPAIERMRTDPHKIFFGLHRERLKSMTRPEATAIEAFWRAHDLLRPDETLEAIAVTGKRDPAGGSPLSCASTSAHNGGLEGRRSAEG